MRPSDWTDVSSYLPIGAGTVSPMASKSEDTPLAAHAKVVAVEDLPGVPAGTKGKVMLRTGFSWIRYRVHFDNGVEVPWLEREQLARPKDYEATTGTTA